MAAHVKTALWQIKQHVEAGKPIAGLHIGTALKLSSWTEDLDLDDWRSLDHLERDHSPTSWLPWVDIALAKYSQIWEQLGMPETREQWREEFWERKAYLWLLIDVTWEGNPYGKGKKSYGVAIIPCQCGSCVFERQSSN